MTASSTYDSSFFIMLLKDNKNNKNKEKKKKEKRKKHPTRGLTNALAVYDVALEDYIQEDADFFCLFFGDCLLALAPS